MFFGYRFLCGCAGPSGAFAPRRPKEYRRTGTRLSGGLRAITVITPDRITPGRRALYFMNLPVRLTSVFISEAQPTQAGRPWDPFGFPKTRQQSERNAMIYPQNDKHRPKGALWAMFVILRIYHDISSSIPSEADHIGSHGCVAARNIWEYLESGTKGKPKTV